MGGAWQGFEGQGLSADVGKREMMWMYVLLL